MKNPVKFLIAAIFLTNFGLTAFAQNDKKQKTSAEIKKAEAFVKTVTKSAKKKKPDLVFADVSDYETSEEGMWKQFDSEKSLEKFREAQETYEIAYVWMKGGKIAAVNTTKFSPSGDWVLYVFSRFYANGNAAGIEREFRTFNGDVIVNRVFLYDESGKILRETETFRDLNTQKTIEKPESFMDFDFEIPQKTSELPFVKLITEKP